ncbi:hypothetical protein [Demequina muriae]|uniref:Uncharacterized protein n=1 Tax=Demequina muriae TaxID=3051664 RepID=A0ABT8GI28_9MICO|nr:hypothetical protein [Demequina sp. EGI L300058]MDN4481092.1 hypothetical protein [Demequina sp. EGI L300058]
MAKFTHEGTEDLQHLADEVEKERQAKGHTPFDDVPENEDGETTREDHEGVDEVLGDASDPARAGIVGVAGRVQRPGI